MSEIYDCDLSLDQEMDGRKEYDKMSKRPSIGYELSSKKMLDLDNQVFHGT